MSLNSDQAIEWLRLNFWDDAVIYNNPCYDQATSALWNNKKVYCKHNAVPEEVRTALGSTFEIRFIAFHTPNRPKRHHVKKAQQSKHVVSPKWNYTEATWVPHYFNDPATISALPAMDQLNDNLFPNSTSTAKDGYYVSNSDHRAREPIYRADAVDSQGRVTFSNVVRPRGYGKPSIINRYRNPVNQLTHKISDIYHSVPRFTPSRSTAVAVSYYNLGRSRLANSSTHTNSSGIEYGIFGADSTNLDFNLKRYAEHYRLHHSIIRKGKNRTNRPELEHQRLNYCLALVLYNSGSVYRIIWGAPRYVDLDCRDNSLPVVNGNQAEDHVRWIYAPNEISSEFYYQGTTNLTVVFNSASSRGILRWRDPEAGFQLDKLIVVWYPAGSPGTLMQYPLAYIDGGWCNVTYDDVYSKLTIEMGKGQGSTDMVFTSAYIDTNYVDAGGADK